MKPDELIEKIRKIKGIEQVEYCPVKNKTLLAFIFRANGDHRYGSSLPIVVRKSAVAIVGRVAQRFISDVKLKIDGSHSTKTSD